MFCGDGMWMFTRGRGQTLVDAYGQEEGKKLYFLVDIMNG